MTEERDVVVIGAGPAGLAAALYAGRALMRTIVLEAKVVGGQIIEAYDVDNYPGFADGVTGVDLVDGMVAQVKKFDVEIVSAGATDIATEGPMKRVTTTDGEYTAPIVIVAAGAYHRRLGVPGEQELNGKGVSYCATCDGAFFRDRPLVVVGGGDAAVTECLFLTRFASEIKLIHRRQGFRAQPGYVKELREHPKVELVLDTVVERVLGEDAVTGVAARNVQTDEEFEIPCEGCFIFIGHDPNTDFLATVLPDHAGDIIPVDDNMETSVPGLYAIGDVREGSYRQVTTAVGEGTTAAMHAEKRIKSLMEQ